MQQKVINMSVKPLTHDSESTTPTFINAVFLKIFKGVPTSLSFLTTCIDLSRSTITPVAITRNLV